MDSDYDNGDNDNGDNDMSLSNIFVKMDEINSKLDLVLGRQAQIMNRLDRMEQPEAANVIIDADGFMRAPEPLQPPHAANQSLTGKPNTPEIIKNKLTADDIKRIKKFHFPEKILLKSSFLPHTPGNISKTEMFWGHVAKMGSM